MKTSHHYLCYIICDNYRPHLLMLQQLVLIAYQSVSLFSQPTRLSYAKSNICDKMSRKSCDNKQCLFMGGKIV